MASPDQLPPSPRPGSPASEQWDKLSSSDSELFSVNASDKPDPPNKDVISDWTSAVSIENSQPPRAVLLSDEQHAYVRELLGEEDLNNLDSVDSISVACTQKVHEAVTNSQRSIWQEIRRLQESFLRENLETEMLLLQIKTTEKKLESKDEQITTLQHRVEVLEQTQSKQGASIDKVSALIRQTIVNETKRSVEINSLRNKIANLEAARQTQEKYMNSRDISIRISIESIEKSQEKQMRIAQSTSNQLDKTSKDHRAWIENMDGKVGQLEDKFMDYAAREQNFCHYLPGALEVYANNVKNHTHDAMSSIAKKFEDRVKIVEGLNKQKVQQADEEQSSQDSLHIQVLKVCVNNLADKVHDCQKYTTHIESNSYEAHQNLQLTIQGIEKKIHDVEGNVGLWRSVAYEMERKVKQLGEDIAAQAKQASSNDSKTDQSSNTCPALGAGYMPMWQHIRNLEKAIVEHSESMDIDLVTRELTALRDCCNMHANVLFNVREDIGDLYEKVQSLRPSPSGPTPIDEDISGAMAVDLSNRLNVVEEQVKEIAPSQERCETQGQLGSGKTGIHLTERVSKAEQRLTVVEAQFRDIDLKQTSSKSDIQALQKESEAQHVKIDGYHQVFDKTAKMTKTLASLRKKTASHGKDIDGNNEACKSGNNAAHARIDDVSVWEDGVKMQVNALFSKIHGLETRIECHEKANRIEAVRRKIPVLTTTALTSMRHDPLVRDKAFNRIKEIMDDGAKDEMETAIRTTGELHKSAVEKGGLEELYKEYTNGRQDRTSTINSSKAPEEAFSKMAPNAGVKVPVGLKNAAQDLASKSFQDGINPSSPAIVDLNSTSKLSKLSKNIRQEIERTNAYNKKQYGSCKIEETETETDGVKEEPAHELSKDKCFNPGFSEDQMVQTEEGIRQHITRRKAAGIEQEPLMSTTGGEEDVTSGEVEAGAKEASKQGEVEKTPQQPIINYSTSYAPSEQEWLSIKSKARELMANVTPELTKHILMKFKAMDISRQAEILEKYHQDPVWGYCMQAAVQRFMDNREARRKMQVAAKAVLSDQERSSESKIQAAPQVATEAGDVREQSLTLDKKGVGSAPQSTEEMIADAQRLAAQKARLSNFTPTPSTEPTKVAAKHSESFDAALEEADKPKMDEQNADLLIAEIEKEVQALREKDRQLKEKKIREFREEERQRIEKAPEVPAGNKITEFTYLTKEQRWVRHDDNKPSTTNQTTSPPKEIKGSDSMAESKIADIKSEEEKTWLEASKAWPELSQGHSTKVGTLLTAMNNANKVLPEHPREQPEKVETLLAALQMERDLPAVDQDITNPITQSTGPQRKETKVTFLAPLTQAEKFKNLEGIMDAHFREPKPSQAVPAKHLEGSYNVDTNPRGPRRVHFAASPEGEKLKAAMDRAVKVLDDSLYTQPEEGQSTDNEEESYEPDEDEESLNGSVIYSPQPQTQSHPQQEENAKNQNNQKPKEILASLLDARSEL